MIPKNKTLAAVLAFLAVFFTITPAFADPISATIAAIAVAVSDTAIAYGASLLLSSVIFYATEALLYVVLAVGLNYLEKALSPHKKANQNTDVSSSGQVIQTGGVLPRSFVVGKFQTPGKLVYANTWGEDGKTQNAYLTMVIALSDIPITGVTGLWVDNTLVTYTGTTTADMGTEVPEYAGKLWVNFYDGTQTVVDPFLESTFGSDPNYPYDSNRVGTGVAYIVVTAKDDPSVFPSIPNIKVEIDGIKLYDQRKDSTAGGSGTHRFSDKTTWEFSENPVVIINNILRGITYNGTWFFGLQNLDVSRVPYDTWFAAANECDALVDNNTGGTEKQYRCGGEISVDLQAADVVDELLKTCNGRLAEVGGIYKIHVGAASSSILSFTDDDILVTEQQTYTPFPSQTSVINGLTASYPSPDQGWSKTDAPARYNSDFEAEDGSRFVGNVDYNMVPYLEQVQRLMNSAVLEARKFRRHILVLPPECWVLEPNDIITYTSTRNGYVNKLFRVDGVTDSPNLDIGVALIECDPADYDWVPGTDYIPRTDGPLVIVRPTPQTISSWAVSPVTVVGDGLRELAGIRLSWESDVTDVMAVAYQVRLTSSSALVLDGITNDWASGTTVISQNILATTAYQVRGKYVSLSGLETAWSSWLDVTTNTVSADLDAHSVTFENLVAELQGYYIEVAAQQRELADEVSLLTNGITQGSLGGYKDITDVKTTMSSNYASLTANYTAAILVATGPSSSIAASITTLNAALTGYLGASAVSNAISSLNTTVTSQGSSITANASAITSLQSALTGYTGASAVSNAFSSLNTTVTSQGSSITANASAITSLQSALTGYTGANAVSNAISALNTTVTSQGTSISTNASAITALTSSVGRINASAFFTVDTAATPSGADARIVLATSATSGGSRVGAALYIDAMTGGTSRVVIESDSFYFNDPSLGPTPLFSISGGQAYFSAPLNAGIINASTLIASNVIVTSHIQDNSVTKTFAYTAGSTGVVSSGTAVISGTDDLSVDYSGYTVSILFVGSITRQGGHSPVMTAQIQRTASGGSSPTDVGIGYQSGGSGIPLVNGMSAIAIDTVPGANAFYRVKITTDDGSTLTSNEAGLIITVLKK